MKAALYSSEHSECHSIKNCRAVRQGLQFENLMLYYAGGQFIIIIACGLRDPRHSVGTKTNSSLFFSSSPQFSFRISLVAEVGPFLCSGSHGCSNELCMIYGHKVAFPDAKRKNRVRSSLTRQHVGRTSTSQNSPPSPHIALVSFLGFISDIILHVRLNWP